MLYKIIFGNKFDLFRGRIFSCVQPFYEWAVSNLGPQRSMHRHVLVAHSSFIEKLHTIKITASGHLSYTTVNLLRQEYSSQS